jgi:alpha-galactosidase
MSKNLKISIIGAGSGEFSMGIVRDLSLTPSLWGSTVSFMDIDEGRLNAIFEVATRYIRELKADIRFEKTLARRDSLQDANFVINCAMSGGWDRFLRAEQISQKHGYAQSVFYDNYYQYKLFMDIIRDMEEVCPEAWYIQSANPVFEGCTLITRQSNIKSVGLCHGFYYGTEKVARVIGLDPDKVEAQAYGLNHNIWLTKFFVDGVDAYPLLAEWVENKSGQYWSGPDFSFSDEMGPKAIDLYKRLGLFPIGDTATPGGDSYHRWYHADKETERKWKEDPAAWYERHIQGVNHAVRAFTELAANPGTPATSLFPPKKTSETNVSIIDAIFNDRPGIFQVNIPNNGCIPGIANDVVVEIPALVSGAGIQGLRMKPLPKRILLQIQERILLMERDLEAFLSRDRKMLLEYVLSYPTTRTIEQAEALLADVFADPANREMAEYYR